ncbi:repressor LexA [Romeria aff. gracilis LEGE 07310]|uniref:LexA repressor n=1 Tax=Vasconcelosia minhoensis LEGE 07310 TaxID=915328 RepID=A0A8J7AXW9_9CYAN|nr:transcriptional repressor LexA [Romeria gracilis]MBE9079608.1 repressor LexA [Romeria aff. gracilis LEGE 07310]
MESLTEAQQELYDWLVQYIRENRHSPSIRQMMRAMKLKSPAPIQSRLEHLRNKEYIDWSEGQARTIRILHEPQGVPILGAIAAGSMVETFTDSVEQLDLTAMTFKDGDFALQVRGDSMIDALIDDGDIVIMRKVQEPSRVRNGTIVAARVESTTTLKYYHREKDHILLKPANTRYEPMQYPANEVDIQGRLVAVWRNRELS